MCEPQKIILTNNNINFLLTISLMKKIFFVIAAAAMMLVGCTKELEQRIDSLDQRVSALEEAVKALNSDVDAIQTVLDALKQNVYVSAVNPLTDGYEIVFTNGTKATIKNGANGKDGVNGKDGKDGVSPVIGVTTVDGVLVWTVNGQPLKDAQGNNVPAVGKDGANGADGKDGQNGADGKDGVTPEFKLENGKLYYSVDGKTTWIELGNVTGADGADGEDANAWFTLTQDASTVTLTLTDGSGTIVLPKYNNFDITIVPVGLKLGETKAISYAVTGSTSYVVRAYAAQGWTVAVNAAKNQINVVAPADPALFLNGYVDVYVICNATGKVCAKSLTFPNAGSEMEVPELEVSKELPVAAVGDAEYEVAVTTDYAYEVEIPEDAKWLTYVETKAARTETLVFKAEPNKTGKVRSTVVKLTVNGIAVAEIPFKQLPVATAVVVAPREVELLIGSSVQLSAAVTPADADQTVTWTSQSYGSVDKTGKVIFNPEANNKFLAPGAVGNTFKVYATTNATNEKGKQLVDSAMVKVTAIQVTEVTSPVELVKAKIGQKFALEYNVLPANASWKEVYFKSSDENVLEVDEDGVVTAKAAGEAKVTIIADDIFAPKAVAGEEYTYVAPSVEVVVAVSGESVLTGLEFAEPAAEMHLKGKYPVVFNQEVKNGAVSYEVLDSLGQKTSYLVVNDTEKGDTVMVSTLAGVENYLNVIAGQTFQVVATVVENPMITDTLALSVYANLVKTLDVQATASLEVGKSDTLEVVVNADADDKTLKFTSLNPEVATVNAAGVVTGVAAGTVKIAVDAMDIFNKVGPAVTDTCVVYVNAGDVYPVTKFEFNKTVKDTVDFKYTEKVALADFVKEIAPEAPLSALDWTVLNAEGVAANSLITVDAAKGTVAINTAEGYEEYLNTTVNKAYMVVATSKYDAKAVDTLVVRPTAKLVETLTLGATELEFTIGAKYQLQYAITSDAADKTVKWSVKGDAVTVDQEGNIEAVKAGEATVVLESMDKFNLAGPHAKAECKIVVNKKPVAAIAFAKDSLSLNVLEKVQLTPVFYADAAKKVVADPEVYNTDVTFSVKAYVSGNGYKGMVDVDTTGLFSALNTSTSAGTYGKDYDYPAPDYKFTWLNPRARYDINSYVVTATCGDVKAETIVTVLLNAPETVSTTVERVTMEAGETFTPDVIYGPASSLKPGFTLSASSSAVKVSGTAVTAKEVNTDTEVTVTVKVNPKYTEGVESPNGIILYPYESNPAPTTTFVVLVKAKK